LAAKQVSGWKINESGIESKFSKDEICGENPVQEDFKLVEEYDIESPFSSVQILMNKKNGAYIYKVIEPVLDSRMKDMVVDARKRFVSDITRFPESGRERAEYIREWVERFTGGSQISDIEKEKLFYLLRREFEGYGKVQVPILDENVEDISCDGSNIPIYIFHKRLGSITSSISFEDDEQLDNYVSWIVQKAGRHISIAVPMADCTLPNGSRLQATLGKEVTRRGSSFTIRRFKDDPFTPLDLIKFKTISSDAAVYLWQAVEEGRNMFIIGGTASGKTTTLNSTLLFIPSERKIVSIEDTREINIPHENWVPTLTRLGTGDINPLTKKRVGEVDMFDLLVSSLRQRPNYIVVGEVRGPEAYTVFQSMATGQTAYSTFHSSDISSFIHRLEGEPLKIPRSMISSLDVVVLQAQIRMGDEIVRRVKKIVEIVGIERNSNEVITNTVFEWEQSTDRIDFSGHSYLYEKILKDENWSLEELNDEITRRKEFLEKMVEEGRINYRDFSERINKYQKGKERSEQIKGSNEGG
jgi:flagellar protein FlaI